MLTNEERTAMRKRANKALADIENLPCMKARRKAAHEAQKFIARAKVSAEIGARLP